jgi:hypothetical protein
MTCIRKCYLRGSLWDIIAKRDAAMPTETEVLLDKLVI